MQGILTKPLHQSHLYDALAAVLTASVNALPYQYAGTRPQALPPLRILLAEDNVVNQRMAQLLLERLSQTADVVSNGMEAVNAATQIPYDLILMDVLMPEMDGLDATRRIRANLPPERQPRIVAMTANALSGDRERCLAAGMDDYISKPVLLEELARVLLRQRLSAEHQREASDTKEPTSASTLSSQFRREAVDALAAAAGPMGAAAVLKVMIDSAPRMLEDMQRALATSNSKELRRHAHSLKANASTVGASALAAELQRLEDLAGSGQTAETRELTMAIDAAYRRLIESIQSLRQQYLG